MPRKEGLQQFDLSEIERMVLFFPAHVFPFLLTLAGCMQIQYLSVIHD